MTRNWIAPIVLVAAGLFGIACSASSADDQEVLVSDEDMSAREDGLTGIATCAPSRAVDVIPWKQSVLLDTIAYAEGTRGRSQDGYNVAFTHKTFSSCNTHPNKAYCSGRLCSTASGRYQFLYKTWKGLGYPNFRPENQERAAMKLIKRRGAYVPTSRALTATEFSNVMARISYEWASLPPGRYGQPSYSTSALRKVYCAGKAGC